MRHSLSSWLEAVLRVLGILLYRAHLARAVIFAGRRRVRVIGYHACEEREHDWIAGLGSNTPPARLRAHLDFLCQHYTVLSLEELEAGNLPDKSVVITFDDGYRSVYCNAFPLLRARSLPATIYVVSAAVDNRAIVWVNELNWLLRTHGAAAFSVVTQRLGLPATPSAEGVIAALATRYDEDLVTSLLLEIRRRVGIDAQVLAADAQLYLTWNEIREMAQHHISFGNHTATHPNLARLSESEQHAEIRACRDALERHGVPCTSLALPFGIAGPGSQRLASDLGHRSVMEAGGGNQKLNLFCIGRLFPQASTEAGFFAELEIVAPIVGWMRKLRARCMGLGGNRLDS